MGQNVESKENAKKSLPEAIFTNLESFDSWVHEAISVPDAEREPF